MEWGINFTAWPEMIAWPYLILQGWLPYRDIAIAHNPLLLLDLVVFFKLFGVGILQLKIYTWVLISINIYITYFVANKFWSKNVAFASAAIYLLLTVVYEGNGLWFDLALVPFVLLLYLFIRQKKYLFAGIIFALGFLTKQTFIYFLIPVLLSNINIKKFLLGVTSIFGIFTLYLFTNNLILYYYDWAIKFGIFYLPNAVGQVQLPTLRQFLFSVFPFLIFTLNFDFLLLTFAFVGVLGVYPRWELFHFQPALPFIAIAVAIFLFSKSRNIVKIVFLIFIFCFAFVGLKRQIGNNTRFYEPEVIKITEEIIKLRTEEIYIINYWDNIYAFTNTIPSTKPLIPYIPWYLSYDNSKDLILNDLKSEMTEAIMVNEKDKLEFLELKDFIDMFYSCENKFKQVELCIKNK